MFMNYLHFFVASCNFFPVDIHGDLRDQRLPQAQVVEHSFPSLEDAMDVLWGWHLAGGGMSLEMGFESLQPCLRLLVLSLSFVFMVQEVISQLPVPVTLQASCYHAPLPLPWYTLSGTASPNKFSLPKVAFYHSNRKNDHYNTHLSLIALWELFHILKFIFIFMHMYLSVCHMCVDASGDQKRVSDFLGLELQVIVSHLAWVLGTELESSGRTTCNFKKSFIFWDYNYIILCFLFLPEDPCTEPSLLFQTHGLSFHCHCIHMLLGLYHVPCMDVFRAMWYWKTNCVLFPGESCFSYSHSSAACSSLYRVLVLWAFLCLLCHIYWYDVQTMQRQ